MSHELRTPLNSLLILAEQLQDNAGGTMTDTQVEYASVILGSGRDLLRVLNSILDLAKAESGTVRVELADVSIRGLRSTLLRDFEHVAQGKGLGYSIEVDSETPEDIVTDSQRLGQILTNLLANAFKFTEHGSVRLQVGPADNGWSPETASLVTAPAVIAFSVSDTGIGIGAEDQKRIFEAFAQGDGSSARNYGGTGLGLSISRELVGLLGGEITVASTPGEGSTFTVNLPLAQSLTVSRIAVPTATANADQRSTALVALDGSPAKVAAPGVARANRNHLDDGPFAGTKVLVVDDNFANIFAMTALLERGGAEVTAVESGVDALATLELVPDIDLVLMDIMMPGMDGYATTRAIRAIDRFKSLPILAVTGKVIDGERERCIAAGANDYVPKPVDTDELLAAIGPWLPTAAPSAA